MKLLLEQGPALCQRLLKLGVCLLLIVHNRVQRYNKKVKSEKKSEKFHFSLFTFTFFLFLTDIADLHAEGLKPGADGVAAYAGEGELRQLFGGCL